MHGEGGSEDVNGRQSGRRGNKGRSRLSWMDDVEFKLEEFGCEKKGENNFGLGRMGIGQPVTRSKGLVLK